MKNLAIIFLFVFIILLIFIKYRMQSNESFKTKLINKIGKLSVIFFMPNWLLIIGPILIFQLSSFLFKPKEISSNLRNNLKNLNGQWYFHNDKEDESFWLQICFDDKSKVGTFNISQKYDNWGGKNTEKTKTLSEGQFNLIEGFDRYGDKAYVGQKKSGTPVFLVTQIENNLSTNWLLRISTIEDQMFGAGMTKLSDDCK